MILKKTFILSSMGSVSDVSTCKCDINEDGQRKCGFDPNVIAKCLPAFCSIDSLELYQAGLGRKDMKDAQVKYH